MLLLTNGQVMAFETGGARCSALIPDERGSYANGTWRELAPMAHSRQYFGSAVLADGRVIVLGGEYGTGNSSAELYNPVTDHWDPAQSPPWPYLSDEPCCLLSDGRLLAGFQQRSGIYDPTTDRWTEIREPMAFDCYETTWTLLADGSVLQPYMLGHPASQRFVPALRRWVDCGPVPADLIPDDFEEVGPALLLYDGRTLEIGASGHTDYYTPPAAAEDVAGPGTWEIGPDLPHDGDRGITTARDAPACLLPNGRPLVAVGAANHDWSGPPTRFFELVAGTWVPATDPPVAAREATFPSAMLLLPSGPRGQALYSDCSAQVWLYTSNAEDGDPRPEWRPRITGCARHLRVSDTYTLFGVQLNGLSQAVSYGDDIVSATNYPLIRLTNTRTGQVRYCYTHDHANMGVASVDGWTNFDIPADVPIGAYELVVVANGIPSEPIAVEIAPARAHIAHYEVWQRLFGSLADGQLVELHGTHWVPVDPLPFGKARLYVATLVARWRDDQRSTPQSSATTIATASSTASAMDATLKRATRVLKSHGGMQPK